MVWGSAEAPTAGPGGARGRRRQTHIGGYYSHLHRFDRLMTNNLLSIKRKFPWYICNSLSQAKTKDLEHAIGSRLRGNCKLVFRGKSPRRRKMPGINMHWSHARVCFLTLGHTDAYGWTVQKQVWPFGKQGPDLQNISRFIIRLSQHYRKINLRQWLTMC